MALDSGKQIASQSPSIQTHAVWFKRKLGAFSPNTDQGVIKLQNGVFSFTTLAGDVQFELPVAGIKEMSTAGKSKYTGFRALIKIVPTEKQPSNLAFGIYKDKGNGQWDESSLREWRSAFKNAGVKVASLSFVAFIALCILIVIVVIFVLIRHK